MKEIRKPAEWEQQGAIMIAWPHTQTDWQSALDEIVPVYKMLVLSIAERQPLLIICHNEEEVKRQLDKVNIANVRFIETSFNDTWTRDYGPFFIYENEKPVLLDYQFNGWGGKYNAELDNSVTLRLYEQRCFSIKTRYRNRLDFVLEGGSVETDGQGLMMATKSSVLSPGRNAFCGMETVEVRLRNDMGIKKVFWLYNGRLEGDDTDGHIDMLARFCDEKTICYVRCHDENDVHYEELLHMEEELKSLTTINGESFRLVPLPMTKAILDEKGKRLPASYANFLIMNEAILMPLYGGRADSKARDILSEIFPGRDIIGINALPLIKQGGSLHCATLQVPKGVL